MVLQRTSIRCGGHLKEGFSTRHCVQHFGNDKNTHVEFLLIFLQSTKIILFILKPQQEGLVVWWTKKFREFDLFLTWRIEWYWLRYSQNVTLCTQKTGLCSKCVSTVASVARRRHCASECCRSSEIMYYSKIRVTYCTRGSTLWHVGNKLKCVGHFTVFDI